jgi:predicted AAA+ superfamily ATPase
MERKFYQELLAWKKAGAKKPLMVIGARQVGKTYLVEKFCKREFDDHITFNLFDRTDLVQLFNEDINTQDKINRLELLARRPIDFEKTVIFFDEVQESEALISALKYFAESPIPYKIVCAGSLLGVKINRFKSSFPVGKVKMLELAPMDFEEYLMACNERGLAAEIRACLTEMRPMLPALHEKALGLYRTYLGVGGMPEALANLVEVNNSIPRFDRSIISDIRTSYISDMNKYILSPLESTRIEDAYGSIPAQLSNKSSKFQFSHIRQGARSREFASALDWLVSSRMVLRCDLVNNPQAPLRGFVVDGHFKAFVNDTGLFCSALDIDINMVALGEDHPYSGPLAESYLACQLAAAKLPLFYWKSGNTAEVDFLLAAGKSILPLEVKAGRRTISPSMRVFVEKYRPPCVIKMSTRNFGFENNVRQLPLYAAFCLSETLQHVVP